ncbi:MAG: hypothetical protein K2P90_02120 [Holosporales bacterium]|nr:hypothetical protein [Holosporales bacterium]
MDGIVKIKHLEQKISALQEKHQKLIQQRQEHLVQLLFRLDLLTIDEAVLVGALLFAWEKMAQKKDSKDPMILNWREAGVRCLRKFRKKTGKRCGPFATAPRDGLTTQSSETEAE